MSSSSDADLCHADSKGGSSDGIRISAVFVILVTSLCTTLFPIVTKRLPRCRIPDWVYNICRYFGSGVILATAFMHLLDPATEELGSPCLSSVFQNYPFALLFALFAGLLTFMFEMLAFRSGSRLAKKLAYDPHGADGMGHGHGHGSVSSPDRATEHSATHLPEAEYIPASKLPSEYATDKIAGVDEETSPAVSERSADEEQGSASASQIIGVAILECGVVFHSAIIGLTLGSKSDGFGVFYAVIVFHQMFEGLGLGVRLAFLPLAPGSWIPYIGAVGYSFVTPIGVAAGIGVRGSFNGNGATANYVTGVLDSVSGGILTYTGFVELIAHDFVFNPEMHKVSMLQLCFNIFCLFCGSGLMSLLAKWA